MTIISFNRSVMLVWAAPDVGREYFKYPLGILYLARALLDKGFDVQIVDQKMHGRSVDEEIRSQRPKVVGVSFTTGSFANARKIARNASDTGAFVIAGGFHATHRAEECIASGFDAVVCGEAENVIAELLAAHFDGANIKGIHRASQPQSLDEVGLPARRAIPPHTLRRYDQAALMGSRGCYYACRFCGSARTGLRKQSPKRILEELQEIITLQPNAPIHFCDDIFTHDISWCHEVLDLIIACNLGITFSVNSRVNVRDTGIFTKLKNAGCNAVAFGVESGSQSILNRVRKGVKIADMRRTIFAAGAAGLSVRVNLIVGLPGNLAEHDETIDLVTQLQPDQLDVSLLTPYPGTEYGDRPQEFGIRLKTNRWPELLSNIYSTRFSEVIEFDHISTEEILDHVDRLKRTFKQNGYISTFDDPKRLSRVVHTFLDDQPLDFNYSE